MNKKRKRGRIDEIFAHRLRAWRKERGFPLKHVSSELGVSVSTLSQWENARRFPTVPNLERLADYMGLHVCCLLYDGNGECHHAPH